MTLFIFGTYNVIGTSGKRLLILLMPTISNQKKLWGWPKLSSNAKYKNPVPRDIIQS